MNIQLWLIYISLNFLNGWMLYYIIYHVVTPRTGFLLNEITSNKPKITPKLLLIGLTYGISTGTIFYWIGENPIAHVIFNIVSVPAFILVIKCVTKEKLLSAALVYALANIIGLSLQFPMVTALQILNLSFTPYASLIMQILSFMLITWFCQYLLLHEIFLFIKMNASMINIIFVFTMAISGFLIHIGFRLLLAYMWFLGAFGLMVLIGVISFYFITVYTMKLRDQIHDTGNLLTGLGFLLKTEKNLEKADQHYTQALERIGFDLPEMKSFKAGKYEDNLLALIEHLKQKHKSKAEMIPNIKYYKSHGKVPIPIMVQMLGTLLDNTFETKTKKPIFVNITVTGTKLEITTTNESDRKTPNEINLMFGRKHSTKKGDRGYGLPKLLKLVKSYGGDMDAHCGYQQAYNSYYLTITIKI